MDVKATNEAGLSDSARLNLWYITAGLLPMLSALELKFESKNQSSRRELFFRLARNVSSAKSNETKYMFQLPFHHGGKMKHFIRHRRSYINNKLGWITAALVTLA